MKESTPTGREAPSSFPLREVLRFLVIPAGLTLLVVVLLQKPWRALAPLAPSWHSVPLVQKDAAFHIVHMPGGPSGTIAYRSPARGLPLRMRVAGLEPGGRYRLDLFVDSATYGVPLPRADASGRLALDTTLAVLADAAPCAPGRSAVPPRAISGRMEIRLGIAPLTASGCTAPGNDRRFVLYEAEPLSVLGLALRR